MSVYNLSPIYRPQVIASGAAKLVFATGAPGNVVPANLNYKIDIFQVFNITAAPVALTLWRVPTGGAAGNDNIVVPVTVLVPVATQTFPCFDATALWGAILTPGESIIALAGAANSLNARADGVVIQL